MKQIDVIVIGVGGIGSAVTYALAKRGLRVHGVDPHGIAHHLGSSHGDTRLIRRAYFEHPDYVPLLDAAYRLWSDFQDDTGQNVFLKSGLYLAGPPNGPIVSGVQETAVTHSLPITEHDVDAAASCWPQFTPSNGDTVLYEEDAGYLLLETCTRLFVDHAGKLGASFSFGNPVTRWEAGTDSCRIEVSGEWIAAENLVFCGGAWTSSLIPQLASHLVVRRKAVFWFDDEDRRFSAANGCPVFGFDTPSGFYYGFPAISERGIKVGNHSGGQLVTNPDKLHRQVDNDEQAEMAAFVAQYLNIKSPALNDSGVCMYTMTADEHFIIDRHPEHDRVLFASGFSGHGYKFAPVVGALFADWLSTGKSTLPVAFLQLDRLMR
ncbi:MAG: N-methyl-L-tryptophan oxidase [Planctomycetota bacterium]|jgi:sarcosine oxidase